MVYLPSLFRGGRALSARLQGDLEQVDHPVARALVRPRLARGTGPDGAWTPRDHRRVLLAGLVVFAAAFPLSMAIFTWADSRPGSTVGTVLTGVGIFVLFGSFYVGWQGAKHLRGALRRGARDG